jgi:cytochrome c peroxidase
VAVANGSARSGSSPARPAAPLDPEAFRDVGRFAVTGQAADLGAFRTPSLRDVARTVPYMHDGSMATLEEVIDFYDGGGRPNPHLDELIRPLRLTEEEKRDLVDFLRGLSGGEGA